MILVAALLTEWQGDPGAELHQANRILEVPVTLVFVWLGVTGREIARRWRRRQAKISRTR